MTDLKTTQNDGDIQAFLANIEHKRRQSDARIVLELMAHITGHAPNMWGDAVIGFDRYAYKRRDGSHHSYMITGLSPRHAALWQ